MLMIKLNSISGFGEWISVKDALPPVETPVLAVVESDVDGKIYSTVIIGMYEDGSIYCDDSLYYFDNAAATVYDEIADDYIIKEGWWETNRYGEYELYAIEYGKVAYWQPLPEAPKR